MALVIEREDGMVYALPEELAIDDGELGLDYPGLEIPRRHGRWVFDAFRSARPREIRVSGTIRGLTSEDADALWAELTSQVLGGGRLRLRRSVDSGSYIVCEPRQLDRDYHRGRFMGSLFTVRITLEAIDSWWYAVDQVGVVRTTAASGEMWTVSHPGTDRRQPITVRVSPASGTLVNPTVEILETGTVAAFTGTITADQVLVVDGAARKAWLEDWAGALLDPTGGLTITNATGGMGTAFQASGLVVRPGTNTVRYTDDAASSHAARVCVEFRPRSW